MSHYMQDLCEAKEFAKKGEQSFEGDKLLALGHRNDGKASNQVWMLCVGPFVLTAFHPRLLIPF